MEEHSAAGVQDEKDDAEGEDDGMNVRKTLLLNTHPSCRLSSCLLPFAHRQVVTCSVTY